MDRASLVLLFLCLASGALSTRALAVPEPTAAPSPSIAPTDAGSATASARPQITSHWDFVDDDSFPIDLRYAANIVDSAGGYVVVTASIDGKSGQFLLDTGASGSVLSDRFIEGLSLKRLGSGSMYGIAGNTIATTAVLVKDLALGRSVLHDVPIEVASGNSSDLGRHLDGILGYEIFAKAIVEVDLSTQRMRVFDPLRFEPTVAKNSYIFDVDLTSRQPKITGTVSGVTIHPIFDTGNELLLSLSDSIRDHNAVVASHAATLTFEGVDGRSKGVDCGRVNRATFGSINYDGPIICFFNGPLFGKDGGIIGFDFLRHFDWTIDYPDKKFVLTPNRM